MRRAAVDRLRGGVQGLIPGYFALVMATGIVSVGLNLLGARALSLTLMVITSVAYVVLLALNLWRFTRFRASVADDFQDPRRAFGFFTVIAGTDVLSVRLASEGWYLAATVLFLLAVLLWLVLGYVIPWTAVLSRSERPLVATANGTWFIWVVASQSVAAAAATLEPAVDSWRRELAVVAVFAWSVGVFLYAAAGVFVAARMMLYPFGPKDLTPPYWVAMGACAITVLAGARIVEMDSAPMVDATRGLVAGASVMFWAFATWLIPALIAAGWWRHGLHRLPLRYEATLWSIIFPLGMYAVAGIYIGQANALPIVEGIGRFWLFAVAFPAWALTFAAMLLNVYRTVLRGGRTPEVTVRGPRGIQGGTPTSRPT